LQTNHPSYLSSAEVTYPILQSTLTDSHHPEGAALFSALCFVCLLLTKYPRGPITGVVPKLQFVLDNKSVAEDDLEWTYGQETSVFYYLKSDYDLLQGIQCEIQTLPIASKGSWVKGHQD
jgi:hypothetical protein